MYLAGSIQPCYTGGDCVDNGVDQLIIDGEAMPVLKDLIRGGRTPEVQEGAVRLLTRLCSTPDAREHVSHAYNYLCLSALHGTSTSVCPLYMAQASFLCLRSAAGTASSR